MLRNDLSKTSFGDIAIVLYLVLAFIAAGGNMTYAQEVSYGVGDWDPDVYGNHRVVLSVEEKADAVAVDIPWRRRDHNIENKKVILVDATTDKEVTNIFRLETNREFGRFIFKPQTTPGRYYLYYLPYIQTGTSYPKVEYMTPSPTFDPKWRDRNKLSGISRDQWDALPKATVAQIQSIDQHNTFYPMEVIATAEETEQLLARAGKADYLLFPEDRKYPVRMSDDLPYKWIKSGVGNSFAGRADRGEYYALQIAVFASRINIEDIDVSFSSLHGPGGKVIPSTGMTCFNTGGTNWDGKALHKICKVGKGKVRPLWIGIQIPREVPSGQYKGKVTITPKGSKSTDVAITIDVQQQILADAGDSEPWRHSRLRWLNSTIAADEDIVKPFVPMTVKGKAITCLGRTVVIGNSGFPVSISSNFSPEVTHIIDASRELLTSPIRLVVEKSNGTVVNWKTTGADIIYKADGVVKWTSNNTAGDLEMSCKAKMEFDGHLDFIVEFSASKETELNDIRLEIPVAKDVAKYMMGMGVKGGYRPDDFKWKWSQEKNQDSTWVGDVNAGIQCAFRDENYSRPLNTNFYLLKPLVMPTSWANDGRGGCKFIEKDSDTLLISTYSGKRTVKPGEKLYYNFSLLITPFKTLDTKGQWSTRYYHSYMPIDQIAETGANTINNHHANDANPYINYPFINTQEMKQYVDHAHDNDMKLKIYYTVRELANRAPELFALRSLDDEILSKGPGGGFSWLQEHLGDDYIAAWFVRKYKDAAVVNSGVSRWHNYYLEGLNWLTKNIGIDGIYIDDVAFDRTIMKRVRKVLDRNRPDALIDLHSANQFNPRDGFANSANLYLEHFPYLNRLWFGEYFDYDLAPDFWLIEVSGIPFGLMGEMLQDGGNPWRGMVYGMTARMPREKLPSRLWKVWDEFGMTDSRMIGYYSPNCPVNSGHPDILTTVYVKDGAAMIAVASWAENTERCKLNIDWKTLGIAPAKAKLTAPYIEGFQPAKTFDPSGIITIEPGKGWLLILE